MRTRKKRIGDLLVESGLLTAEQLEHALKAQKESNERLGDVLISHHFITEQQLIEVLEFQLGIPHVQLFRQEIDSQAVNAVPKKLAELHTVLPLRYERNRLILAMVDPLDYHAIDEVQMAVGMRVQPVIATKDELTRAIRRYYGLQESVDQVMESLEGHEEEVSESIGEEAPVVRTVNQIITQAVQVGASDIHFDPLEDGLRIRFRVDGMMRTERTLPKDMHAIILARIKIMADLNVAERRLPQDGRVKIDIALKRVDVRISTIPTIHGEKAVMRILDISQNLTDLDQLGFSDHNLKLFLEGIQSPYGTVLVTGPTGSGKSTTLYAALSRLNKEHVNIVTIEDPVEYQLAGVSQMQINPSTGLTFASGLRSVLRQDPDIVMVGEIRDMETAEIAIRAAMTGHLVLSTLHTNDAVNAITRLIDMGVEPFLVASSVHCIVAQRLVRKVCNYCEKVRPLTEDEKIIAAEYEADISEMKIGAGCGMCGQTGYKGRIAIHEVLLVDDYLQSMIVNRNADVEYRNYVKSLGFRTMMQDGIEKVVQGLTTLEEVFRVMK